MEVEGSASEITNRQELPSGNLVAPHTLEDFRVAEVARVESEINRVLEMLQKKKEEAIRSINGLCSSHLSASGNSDGSKAHLRPHAILNLPKLEHSILNLGRAVLTSTSPRRTGFVEPLPGEIKNGKGLSVRVTTRDDFDQPTANEEDEVEIRVLDESKVAVAWESLTLTNTQSGLWEGKVPVAAGRSGLMTVQLLVNGVVGPFCQKVNFLSPPLTRDYSTLTTEPVLSFDHKSRGVAAWTPSGTPSAARPPLTFISDFDQHKVVVYNGNTGERLFTFGSEGFEDGEIAFPAGVAVTPSGSQVFVCDFGNERVQVFSLDGKFLFGFEEGLGGPHGVALYASRQEVHVANRQLNCLTVHEVNTGELVRQYGAKGSGEPGKITRPSAVCINPTADLSFVGDDANPYISVFRASTGEFLGKIGSAESGRDPRGRLSSGEWNRSLAVNPKSGHVVATDRAQKRAVVFSASGEFVGEIAGLEDSAAVGFGPSEEILVCEKKKGKWCVQAYWPQ